MQDLRDIALGRLGHAGLAKREGARRQGQHREEKRDHQTAMAGEPRRGRTRHFHCSDRAAEEGHQRRVHDQKAEQDIALAQTHGRARIRDEGSLIVREGPPEKLSRGAIE